MGLRTLRSNCGHCSIAFPLRRPRWLGCPTSFSRPGPVPAFTSWSTQARFEAAGIRVPGFDGFPVQIDSPLGTPPFDVDQVRRDFPILQEHVNGRPLVWLDNAATTQKPQAVIDRLSYFYEHENSNIHRAAHELAARATDAYEGAREKVRAVSQCGSTQRNCVRARSHRGHQPGGAKLGAPEHRQGDEIVITWLEHHANIVPWQRLAEKRARSLRRLRRWTMTAR